MKCSFALLSGGSSRRFVSDKTKALLYGKPLFLYGLECGLEVSDDVLHISKNKDKYKPFINNVKYLEDELDVICPMSGLITAQDSHIIESLVSANAYAKFTNEMVGTVAQGTELDAYIFNAEQVFG